MIYSLGSLNYTQNTLFSLWNSVLIVYATIFYIVYYIYIVHGIYKGKRLVINTLINDLN